MVGPKLLQVLGHELRWKMVSELAKSDLKVGEITSATREAQNLVSYHLRVLRDAGLVRERRSSDDGRDIYYSLDRRAVTHGLLGTLAAISPNAAASTFQAPPNPPATGLLASVLFLCTGNSARSQIAEALLRTLGGRRVRVRSAGLRPVGVHPQVHDVLGARGIRSGNLRSKRVTEFAGQEFDYAITLCDIARAEPVELAGKPHLLHWSIPDPATVGGGQVALTRAFESVADEIEIRVEDFYADLRTREPAA